MIQIYKQGVGPWAHKWLNIWYILMYMLNFVSWTKRYMETNYSLYNRNRKAELRACGMLYEIYNVISGSYGGEVCWLVTFTHFL